ncbi:MAG TPA: hypothetical protein VEN78_16825 [Bradyrhizobium sp.]|jgi:hypothetical protein|nr:hypothetical protein [Bradyrhizobium sp.]
MPPPRGARPGKKEFWFQCGKYYARTVEDASDRRADWLSDSWTVHVLNSFPVRRFASRNILR